VRTPKFDITKVGEKIARKQYFSRKISKVTLWEGFFFLYFSTAMIWGIVSDEPAFLIMHILLSVGYGLIFYFSIRNAWAK
ncbi:MAG: histidine kinase, partial [Bacteroidota bacterium]